MNEKYMKLIYYFIVCKNYEAIKINGLVDEIWLKNTKEKYKIVRIVKKNIEDAYDIDKEKDKIKQLSSKIKKRSMILKLKILNIYLNYNQKLDIPDISNNDFCTDYNKLSTIYNDINQCTEFSETGVKLMNVINEKITEHNASIAKKYNKTFRETPPYLTYLIIALNILIYSIFLMFEQEILTKYALNQVAVVNFKQFYRLITYSFLHSPYSILHLVFNMLTLIWIGPFVERYYGKIKFVLIYFFTAITGGLLSISFSNSWSVGASSAIFGLIGAVGYFAYLYKDLITASLLKEMIFVVITNLAFGFVQKNIDNFGHIGGLIGGVLIAYALGANRNKTILSYIISITLLLSYFIALLLFSGIISI